MHRSNALENLLFAGIGFGLGALCAEVFGRGGTPEPDYILEQAPLPAEGIPVDPAAQQPPVPPQRPSTAVQCGVCTEIFDVDGDLEEGEEVTCPNCGQKTYYQNEA